MYGADRQMENQARLALRLANFISAFLQVRSVLTIPPGWAAGDDQPLPNLGFVDN